MLRFFSLLYKLPLTRSRYPKFAYTLVLGLVFGFQSTASAEPAAEMTTTQGTAPSSATSPRRGRNSFELPQTNFFFATTHLNTTVSIYSLSTELDIPRNGLNGYGFEIEVNYFSFMNIGADLRVDSWRKQTPRSSPYDFSSGADDFSKTDFLVGGFVRFFYIPPFLRTGSWIANVFTRLDLAGGATLFNGPSVFFDGLLLQPSAHVGFETYFNRWLGASISYGQVFEFGSSSSHGITSTLSANGQIMQVALKTTFF